VTDLLAGIRAIAERSGWTSRLVGGERADEHHLLLSDIGVGHVVVVTVHVEATVIVCASIAPQRFDLAARPSVMEFVTRANAGLVEGKFELDLDDGEVRFTTSMYVDEANVDGDIDAVFGHCLAFNLVVFELYEDALAAVGSRSMTPAEAIASVEAP